MPIMDEQLLFSESQDMTTTSGVAIVSTNIVYIPQVLDHTGTSRNDRPNVSKDNCLNIVVEDEAFVGSGSIITIGMYEHTASGTPAASGNLVLQAGVTLAAAGLPIGYQIASIPLPVTTMEPFLQLSLDITTAALTEGYMTAWIGPPIQQGGEHGAL